MAVTYLDPNIDDSVDAGAWVRSNAGIDYYANVNKAVRFPTAPSTTPLVIGSSGPGITPDSDSGMGLGFTDLPVDVTEVTGLRVYVYGRRVPGASNPNMTISATAGPTLTDITVSMGTTNGWSTGDFDFGAPIPASEINNMVLRFFAPNFSPISDRSYNIIEIYVEATYSSGENAGNFFPFFF